MVVILTLLKVCKLDADSYLDRIRRKKVEKFYYKVLFNE